MCPSTDAEAGAIPISKKIEMMGVILWHYPSDSGVLVGCLPLPMSNVDWLTSRSSKSADFESQIGGPHVTYGPHVSDLKSANTKSANPGERLTWSTCTISTSTHTLWLFVKNISGFLSHYSERSGQC
jgi:hypothetical protein